MCVGMPETQLYRQTVSAAANKLNYFKLVAVMYRRRRPLRLPNNSAVMLDGDPIGCDAQYVKQRRDREPFRNFSRISIYNDLNNFGWH